MSSYWKEIHQIHLCIPSIRLKKENIVRDLQILVDSSLQILVDLPLPILLNNSYFVIQNSILALSLLGRVPSVLDGMLKYPLQHPFGMVSICLVIHYIIRSKAFLCPEKSVMNMEYESSTQLSDWHWLDSLTISWMNE